MTHSPFSNETVLGLGDWRLDAQKSIDVTWGEVESLQTCLCSVRAELSLFIPVSKKSSGGSEFKVSINFLSFKTKVAGMNCRCPKIC